MKAGLLVICCHLKSDLCSTRAVISLVSVRDERVVSEKIVEYSCKEFESSFDAAMCFQLDGYVIFFCCHSRLVVSFVKSVSFSVNPKYE